MSVLRSYMQGALTAYERDQRNNPMEDASAPDDIMTGTEAERDIAIRTMLGEARGEGPEGMAAVLHVMKNRAGDPRWPGKIEEVALQPKQFSAWNKGAGGNNPEKYDPMSPEYQEAAMVYDAVMSGKMPDPTGGATHYYSPVGMKSLVESGAQGNRMPRWWGDESAKGSTTIGNHRFAGKARRSTQSPFSGMGGGSNSAMAQYVRGGGI